MKAHNYLFALIVLTALLLGITAPASAAQTTPGQIVSVNKPISAELRSALETWLLEPPSPAVYYAVTYTQKVGDDIYVSMVGLNIENPDDEWSITGDVLGEQQVIWMDTVLVDESGAVSFPYASPESTTAAFKVAAPIYTPQLAGGGSYVRFPWQPAKAVQFGILGVHDAEYGTGGVAVDLVSGSDMGSGAADDWVYSSAAGDITHICDYGDTVAVRVTGDNDMFLYAHLLPNANLELDHTFAAGERIGRLKHGTFTDECGNAFQKSNHWHVHWGFQMSGGKFQAEGCTIAGVGPLSKWKCGNTEIKPLGFLYHYGNIGSNPDPGTVGTHNGIGAGGGPSFWDYLIDGASQILDALIVSNLPDHSSTSNTFIYAIMNSVKIVFRIVNVLIRSNLNLVPAATVVVIAIGVHLGLWTITLAGYIVRLIKALPGA